MSASIFKAVKYNHKFSLFKKNVTYNSGLFRSALTTNKCRLNAGYQIRNVQLQLFSSVAYKTSFSRFIKFDESKVNRERNQTFDELFKNLNTYFIANGHVNPQIFMKTIYSLENKIDLDTSLFLLEACANYLPSETPTKRMEMFNKIWEHLKLNNLLEKYHYLKAIRVFKKNHISLTKLQKFFLDCPIKNDSDIYEGLISLACENGDVQQATEILTEMRGKNLPLTENIFNHLIVGHSRNKDIKNCELVLDTMKAANILSSSETIINLIQAYIENDLFDKAEKLLTEEEKTLNSEQVIKIIKHCAEKNNRNLVERLFKLLPDEILNVKEIHGTIRNCCIEFIYSGKTDKAVMIVDCFPTPKFNDNEDIDDFGVFLINEMIRNGKNTNSIIEISKKLVETNKNSRALHIACEIILKRNPDLSFEYLKALSEIDKLKSHYFWPLFLHSFQKSGEIGIIDTIKKMSELKVECDYETLSQYCLPRLTITLNDPEKCIKTFEKCGLKTSQLFTPLIIYMIKQQKLDGIIKLTELYHTKLDVSKLSLPLSYLALNMRSDNKNYKTFAKVIKSICLKSDNQNFDLCGQMLMEILTNRLFHNDIDTLTTVIHELKLANVEISSIAADALSGHLSKFKDNRKVENAQNNLNLMINKNLKMLLPELTGTNFTHPRDMNLNELECHLIELESKKLNTRGVLRRLLQLCVRENRLERAVEIKQKCDALKVNISPGMMASVFDMHIKLKDIKAAEETMQLIQSKFPGFLVDEHKIIDFAALLIEKNQREKAINSLRERAESGKLIGGEYINKNIWHLLTKNAQSSEISNNLENSTKELFILLNKLGFCEPTNAILGPVIREYLHKNNLKDAIKEYHEIIEKYRKTPLQFELMSILVGISNGKDIERYNVNETEAKDLLQSIITLTTKIHGGTNVNSVLLLAVAQSGTENQLRKLLINPEFRINNEALTKNCNHLSITGSFDTIMRLAKACRGLGHVLKEEDIYNIIMENFVKTNNFTSALSLFDKLEADDDLKISKNFIKSLVDLLRVNNIEIPTEISLRLQMKN